jgi:hypothetical protein
LRGIVGFGRLALCLASGLLVAGNPASAETYRLLELEGRDAVRWRMPAEGAPAKITYAFLAAPASFEGARNCGGMLPPGTALGPSHIREDDFRREVRAAFTVWEQAANIVFEETSSTADAGILIGADAKPRGRAFTNVALATSEPRSSDSSGNRGVGDIRQSLICLNPHQPWKIGFDGNLDIYDLRFTMTHEIGHAIGLDHPGPEGQLMSFRYVEKSRDLQPGDIDGAAALYGRKGSAPNPQIQFGYARSTATGTTQPTNALGLSEAAKR